MQLIGMLDSPYVRRVAISLQMMGIPFEHHALSVFSDAAELSQINPLIKAPTLVCDDGTILMDSNLILEYLNTLVAPEQRLGTPELRKCSQQFRLIGLALNACDKSVQYFYETGLRPESTRHQPWIDRIVQQIEQAYYGLNEEMPSAMLVSPQRWSQAAITAAVAFKFTDNMVPASVCDLNQFSNLVAWSQLAEKLPEFQRAAYGDKAYPVKN
jgi:glutathione S-transferase